MLPRTSNYKQQITVVKSVVVTRTLFDIDQETILNTRLLLCDRLFITARKRSLQRLCFHRYLSVHGGGHAWLGVCAWERGMCGGGACMAGGVQGRGCAWLGGRVWQERRPLQRAVRILLGCILVKS